MSRHRRALVSSVSLALVAVLAACGAPPSVEGEAQALQTKLPGNFCRNNLDCGDGSMGTPTCDWNDQCDYCRLNGCIYNRNCSWHHETPYMCPDCYKRIDNAACDFNSGQCIGCPKGTHPDSPLNLTCFVDSCNKVASAAADPARSPDAER